MSVTKRYEHWKMDVSNPCKGLNRKGDPQKEKRLQYKERSLTMGK